MTPDQKKVMEAVIHATEKASWTDVLPDNEAQRKGDPGAMKTVYHTFSVNRFVENLKKEMEK